VLFLCCPGGRATGDIIEKVLGMVRLCWEMAKCRNAPFDKSFRKRRSSEKLPQQEKIQRTKD
jgi:hypothetical protein